MTYVALLFVITGATNSWADAAAIKQKAVTCGACHGPNGVSPNPLWPNLAGQKEQYLFKQLMAFKTGVRLDPLMSAQAKMLDEQDMRDLARYFAELKASP